MKWFASIKLDLSLDKKKYNEILKKKSHSTLHDGFKENYIEDMHNALWYIETLATQSSEKFTEF